MRATTLGALKASGYPDRSVKAELRDNLLARISSNAPLFEDIVGYEETVVPALERALLAGHDVIMLGERGQAKSRLIRQLTSLLDDEIPVIAGCEINDHPYRPICARCRALVAERGDDTPLEWIGREQRYAEKLATPDTAVADLIGDVDPIRVAEGRYLADELTIHYGLVPRTNRGIFAINELPDLPERIQVSLLNILEERDVQVRGYKIRLPLDLMLIASANPEDYTHRGRIITPLKDRFGTQVRTHYPRRPEEEIAIMRQEARPLPPGIEVKVALPYEEILARFTARLRSSRHVNQRSGVSVRFSIGNLETIRASALRRAARCGEDPAVPRVVDLWTVLPASLGRIEFDTLDEGREPDILARALKAAILDVWRARLGDVDLLGLIEPFEQGAELEVDDLTPAGELLGALDRRARRALETALPGLDLPDESPPSLAAALELCLEALYLEGMISKHEAGAGAWRFGGSG